VTFTWMPNPNGDTSLISYMRRKMIPEVSWTLLTRYHTENCYYGEFVDMMNPGLGWIYESSDPRYLTNYYGLRNRLAILNENYVYADFKSRVYGCYNLLWSVLDFVTSHKTEIRTILKEVDKLTYLRGLNPDKKDSMGIEFKVRPAGKVTIKTFEAELIPGEDIWRRYKKTDRQITVTVPYLVDYFPSKSVKFPFAYVLTANDPDVIDLLKIQGIKLEQLDETTKIIVEKFEITDLKAAPRLNQGHYENTIKGSFITDTIDFPAGTIIIRTSQPLANLAAYLLEPQSKDGLVTWNYLDGYLVPQWGPGYNTLPVYKVIARTDLKTRPAKE
jgi:hypothetical protein